MINSETRESVVLENFGQKIFGILHRPIHVKNYPALLMCHGLAGHKTGKYRLYVILAQMLAKAGIASLRIDFRGSGDSEGDFADMTLDGEVSDALKGLDFLEKDPYIDQSCIGLFGRSIGGTVALIAARRHGGIKSICTWAPLYDTSQWEDQWKILNSIELSPEDRNCMMSINGQIPGHDFLKQLFSVKMEEELKGLESSPLLHIHGELDNIINIEHANRYLLRRQNVMGKNKFIRLPGGDHDFSDPKEQLIALDKTCQWFVDTLCLN
ncbi:MAG: alpha/beta fold hydrolase [Parachlamydiaceae bacterium]|nr:alpha/beta fold hydrolase [Parachlamydiaceae bacterium]